MRHKIKDINTKTEHITFPMVILIKKFWFEQHWNRWKVMQKCFYLLYWICGDRRICNNLYCKSFITLVPSNERKVNLDDELPLKSCLLPWK